MASNNLFLSIPRRLRSIGPFASHDVALNEPSHLNLDKLAEATNRSLELLKPWCKGNEQRALAHQPISDKARMYLGAIEDSVKAAQSGYSVAQDAIRLLKTLNANAKEECDKYTLILLEHAAEAHKCALDSLQKFRCVRQELTKLISDALAKEGENGVKADLNRLEKQGIPVFEEVAKCVEKYIKWWSWIELSTIAHESNARQLSVNYTKIRGERAVKKWDEIQATFLQYTNKIAAIQDGHIDLFPSITKADSEQSYPDVQEKHLDSAPDQQDLNLNVHVHRIISARKNHRQQKPLVSRAFATVLSFGRCLICL